MIASSDSLALEGGTKTHERVTTWNLHTLSLYDSWVCTNLQSAAERSDPVQPVVE